MTVNGKTNVTARDWSSALRAQKKQEHEQDEADETGNICRIELNSCSLAKKKAMRKKGLTNNLES